MKRPARMAVIGLGVLLVALFPSLAGSPDGTPQATAPATSLPGVRVEHRLVEATVVGETPVRRPVARRSRPLARQQPRALEPMGFVTKARQLIVGNGRHRPEPFPRVGQ